MKILYLGDIVGKIGRRALVAKLPELIKKHQPDFVFANAENLAHGSGISESTIKEMRLVGVDFFSSGNHVYDNESGKKYLDQPNASVIRPANWGENGDGYKIIEKNNLKVLLINLLGQVFINKENIRCPFKTIDTVLEETKDDNISVKIVDFHAETTSEKQALFYYLDGRVSAVLGTHTHVPTTNARISNTGTCLVEDIGMVGGLDSIIGAKKENVLHRFLTKEKVPLEPPKQGPALINSVLLEVDKSNGQAQKIQRIDLTLDL